MTREELRTRELELSIQGWRARLERVYQQHGIGPAVYRRVEEYELKNLIPGIWLYDATGGVIGRVGQDGVARRLAYAYSGSPVSTEPFHVYTGRLQVKACDCEDCAKYRVLFLPGAVEVSESENVLEQGQKDPA